MAKGIDSMDWWNALPTANDLFIVAEPLAGQKPHSLRARRLRLCLLLDPCVDLAKKVWKKPDIDLQPLAGGFRASPLP